MYSFKLFLRDPWIGWPALSAGLGVLFAWWFTLFYLVTVKDAFFLHYTVVFGVDWIASPALAVLLPAGGSVIFIANILATWWAYRTDPLLARLLLWANTLLQAGVIITLILLRGLNR